jgi:nicotinamide riboside kinase
VSQGERYIELSLVDKFEYQTRPHAKETGTGIEMATDAMRRNIYIIGAQCTGKTTLVNALEASFTESQDKLPSGLGNRRMDSVGPIIIREVARTVLKEKNFSRDDITSSPMRALQLQEHILEAQLKAETAIDNEATPMRYLCDRSGLDPIVYARLFVGEYAAEKMLASPAWAELEKRMQAGIVLLCEAGCKWLVDDGTRLMPTGEADWIRIDGAFRELLEARRIAYTVISRDVVSIAERIELVKRAMKVREAA